VLFRSLGAHGGIFRIENHADDVVAAIAQLKTRADIDPSRIILMGSSRGAWIAPVAARRSGDDVAAIIVRGAAAVGVEEQDMQSLVAGLRDDSVSETDVEDALAYARLFFATARDQALWPALREAAVRAAGTPWGDYVNQPETLDDLAWWAAHLPFDPVPAWRDVSVPVFAAWGGRDWVTPPDPNAALLRDALARANSDALIKVYPTGDHRLERPFDRNANGQVIWFGLAQGYFDDLDTWLAAHGLAP